MPEYTQQNAALLPKLIRTNTAGFDRALMESWSGADFTQERPAPVFLISFFRSGTTLTQEVLDVHPDVFVADETDFIWAVHRELHRMDPSHASTADKLRKLDLAGVKHLRAFYWNRAQARLGDAIRQPVFVDKFTLNTIDLGLINYVFPDAKVVFVMRDPRDVCLSCYMQLMVLTPATVHLLDWQQTANFYGQVMTWWMHIKQRMTLDCFEFRYEDAVMQFEPTYRRLFDFLGLSWIPEFEDQSRALAGDLPEAGVGHFGDFCRGTGSHPGAAGGLVVKQAHLAEELSLVQIGQHHLVAVLVLDHHFDRAIHDVVEAVRHVAGVDHDGLARYGAYAAVGQKTVDCRNFAQ